MPSVKHVLFAVLAYIAATAIASEAIAASEFRTALVIGNNSYKNGALRNPVNDARAVADKLKLLGFKVLLRENATRDVMYQAIDEFASSLHAGGVGLFFYAGHGMQIKGKNFLVPVDTNIQAEEDIEFLGIDANMVLSRMDAARSRVNLIVLDACRNNPFARNDRSGTMGLAHMDAPKGTLIAFSTAPGSLAKDNGGSNSVYTKHLIEYLATPALPVEQMFKEVRVAVARETQDKQIPWESSSLMGDFYFVSPGNSGKPAVAEPAAQGAQPDVARPSHIEAQASGAVPTAAQQEVGQSSRNLPIPSKATKKQNYDREGYEIELRAKSLTIDQVPEMEDKANAGDVMAQTTLGWAYLLGKGPMDGRGIPRDNTMMLYWTKLAVQQGYPVAQNNLGAIYMEGTGVKLDYRKAQHYFNLAAKQGYLTAQRNLLQVNVLLTGKINEAEFNKFMQGVSQQMSEPVQ